MPSLEGIRQEIKVAYGFEKATGPARALIQRGLLTRKHFDGAGTVVEVLQKAIEDVLDVASMGPDSDPFSIEVHLSDRLGSAFVEPDCLFFTWATNDVCQYIPLQPVFEELEGHLQRERLMATLYQWLYLAAGRVCYMFGYQEAEDEYNYAKERYSEARLCGEDADLEGEVEAFQPSLVASYIRTSAKLMLNRIDLDRELSSISCHGTRRLFEKAQQAFRISRRINLPKTSPRHEKWIDSETYYMDSMPLPGLCVSHSREDPIVAWLDQVSEVLYENGMTCPPAIIRAFSPNDTTCFLGIISALPAMVQTVKALSDAIQIAEEMENEFRSRDRR